MDHSGAPEFGRLGHGNPPHSRPLRLPPHSTALTDAAAKQLPPCQYLRDKSPSHKSGHEVWRHTAESQSAAGRTRQAKRGTRKLLSTNATSSETFLRVGSRPPL